MERTVVRRLLFVDEARPRLVQAVIATLMALGMLPALRMGLRGDWPGTSSPQLLAAVVLLPFAVLLVPWHRLPASCVVALPLLDLAVLGLARVAGDGRTGTAFLVVVPTLWLARSHSYRGALVAGGVIVAVITVPWLVLYGIDGPTDALALVIPVVALWTGLVLAAGTDLLEQQRRFNTAVLDSVDVGLVLLDATGRYLSVNTRHAAFMRVAYPEGHRGRAGQTGEVYAEDATALLEHHAMPSVRASRGEEFDDARIWIGPPDHRLALSVSARSVHDADGRFAGAALAYKDVTELIRAIEVKDEFIASVSHELRTPLTSIAGYTQLLLEKEGRDPGEQRQLRAVHRNVERLSRLVGDLLQTAQLERGRVQLLRTSTDLSAVVRDSLATVSGAAEVAGVTIAADVPDELVTVIDADRMAQVVDNLLSNAVKHTPRGGRVSVLLSERRGHVELTVSDTGIGLEQSDQAQVFARFFRSREAARRSIQGVGLGLWITKAIIEGHGGWVVVESSPGEGATFRVVLPRGAAAGDTSA